MNAATQTFISDLNSSLESALNLPPKQAVAAMNRAVEQLEARNIAEFSYAPADEIDLTDEQWAKVIRSTEIARGFAKSDANDIDNG